MEKRNKTGGRKKGTPNRITSDAKEVLQKIITKEIKGISKLLEKLDPEDRVEAITKLLPYIIPKQIHQQQEINFSSSDRLSVEDHRKKVDELIEKYNKNRKN